MSNKAAISLTTGLEDAERVTVALLVAVGAAESGRPTLMFLTKEAVRLALNGTAVGTACDGCPSIPDLMGRYASGGRSPAGVPGLLQRQAARQGRPRPQRRARGQRAAVGVDRRRRHDLQLLGKDPPVPSRGPGALRTSSHHFSKHRSVALRGRSKSVLVRPSSPEAPVTVGRGWDFFARSPGVDRVPAGQLLLGRVEPAALIPKSGVASRSLRAARGAVLQRREAPPGWCANGGRVQRRPEIGCARPCCDGLAVVVQPGVGSLEDPAEPESEPQPGW